MATLYERLDSLCKEREIKGARMCRELGISKSLMTDLKSGRKKGVSADTAEKIASYFDVSVSYLLGKEENKKPTDDGELSEAKRELISFVNTLQEDAAESMLRMMKAYYEEWQRNQQ